MVLAALVGLFVPTFANALLHPAYHRFDPLWRWAYQIHHSIKRLYLPGDVVFRPWEIIIDIARFQGVIAVLRGLDPLAAAVVGYVGVFYGLFQHFNVRTPPWLGYIIQRPESHGVHHRRGMHAYNYSYRPLWDMLWGTFGKKPRQFLDDVGFEGDSAARIAPTFVGGDANAPNYGPRNRGRSEASVNPA
ncbi:MAG: sterol desaturase family protein [Betaproteobacteria bacterium]